MKNLGRDDWITVMRLLDAALDLPADSRVGWLETLPPEQRHLHATLAELLADRAAIETGDFLASMPLIDCARQVGAGLAAGQRVGPYELLRELGAGGMASVWLACRADGAHRREVALKLPYLGPHARSLGERFARERAILSSLSHPNVASVLDAGEDRGQPWLAMEYVHGESITAWAQQRALDVTARLRLFLQVLNAVQYAHAQLVIHRDIKPSNVLVDAEGRVKLLDFGVAKLLDAAGDGIETELTRLGGRALTPHYASPEQIAGRTLGTASDIYSLGVLLYELITGRLPYTLRRSTSAALEDAILGAEIIRPSAVDLPRATQRQLRGDIDTVVLKALSLSPGDRYRSAESFARDIERHLESRPIQARPANLRYRAGKWLARNRVGFSAGLAVTLALVAGAGTAFWQARLARAEARRAEAVQQFLIKTLSGADPENARGESLSALELLDRSAGRIDTDFADQPEVRNALHAALTDLYYQLGENGKAVVHADKLVQSLEAAGDTESDAYFDALSMQTDLRAAETDPRTEAMALRALELVRRSRGEPNKWAGNLLGDLAWIVNEKGRVTEAVEIAERMLAMERAASGARSARYLGLLGTAMTVAMDSDLRRARRWAEEAAALAATLPGVVVTDRLTAEYNLARIQVTSGDFEGAAATLRELLPQVEHHLGRQADLTIFTRSLLAQSLMGLSQYDEAIRQQRQAGADTQSRVGVDEKSVAVQDLTLVRILHRAGRYEEGLRLGKRTLATMERLQSKPTLFRERLRVDLALLLISSGDDDAGVAALKEALENMRQMSDYQRLPSQAIDRVTWLVATRGDDDRAAARQIAAPCETLRAMVPANSVFVPRCDAIHAWLAGDLEGLRKARELLAQRLPPTHPLLAELKYAESELISSRDPVGAAALEARARADYQRVLDVPLSVPLRVLH